MGHFDNDNIRNQIFEIYDKLILNPTKHQVTTIRDNNQCMICHKLFKTSLSNHLNVVHRIDYTRKIYTKYVLFYHKHCIVDSPYCKIFSTVSQKELASFDTPKDFWQSELFTSEGLSFWKKVL